MNAVWGVAGMSHFVRAWGNALGWVPMVEAFTGDVDTCLIVGMYDIPYYDFTLENTKRAKQRVIMWCGTDVQMLTHPEFLPEAVHVCETERLRVELMEHGIEATVVTSPSVIHAEVTPLPEKPAIAVYYGSNPEKYGSGYIRMLSEAFPDTPIITCSAGQYGPKEMQELIGASTVIVRLIDHDGSAVSLREFMEAGRYAVSTTDLPHVKVVSKQDPAGIIRAVRAALAKTEPDWEAAAYYHAFNAPERFAADIKAVLR